MKLLLLLVVLSFSCGSVMAARREWSVIVDGDLQTAHEVANENGFQCMGQIGNLPNHYRFHLLLEDTTKELVELRLANHNKVLDFTEQVGRIRIKKGYTAPTDKMWPHQWSLNNTGLAQTWSYGPAGLDLNIEKAWLQGLDGTGVLVGVVDNGVQWDSDEIRANYDPRTSFNFVDNTSDPSPDPDEYKAGHGTSCAGEIAMVKNNDCGVGVAYNSKIAGLRIGLGLGNLTDAQEASALGHMNDDIMIYSNSWGSRDDGMGYDGPDKLLQLTFKKGTEKGRNGKGSIYVWASGNGGGNYDSCAADGYVNSIYTIAIGSADQKRNQAYYDESCTSKMAVTYSFNSDHWNEYDDTHQIVTIDLNNQCIDNFTGTSASAPLVSGTIALVLERNPNLSWRDIQYLIAYTSDPTKLYEYNTNAWTINGARLKVSSQFGFGAIDAEAMVTRATHWTNVPEQISARLPIILNNLLPYYDTKVYRFSFEVTKANTSITYLEHVAVTVNFTMGGLTEPTYKVPGMECQLPNRPSTTRSTLLKTKSSSVKDAHPCDYKHQWTNRGDIRITLTSPAGTNSLLLPNRPCDICQDGLENWTFMSVHYWGEKPVGTWIVTIEFDALTEYLNISGVQTLDIYGVTKTPESVYRIPSSCDPACVRGCAQVASGSQYCDSCKNYRDQKSLQCVSSCNNKTAYNGYCLDSDNHSKMNYDIIYIAVGSFIGGCVTLCLILTAVGVCIKLYRMRKRRQGYTLIETAQ